MFWHHRIVRTKNTPGDVAVGNGEYSYTIAEVFYQENGDMEFYVPGITGVSVSDIRKAFGQAMSLPILEVE